MICVIVHISKLARVRIKSVYEDEYPEGSYASFDKSVISIHGGNTVATAYVYLYNDVRDFYIYNSGLF